MRDQIPHLTPIKLSLDDTVLNYTLHSPKSLDNRTEEHFELSQVDDTRPESGSSALLR